MKTSEKQKQKEKLIISLFDLLGFDYQSLSTSGQEAYNVIWELLEVDGNVTADRVKEIHDSWFATKS